MSRTVVHVAASVLALASLPAVAQQASMPGADHARNDALIGEHVAEQARGRVAINQAAGEGNAQVNLAAIAAARDGTALTAAVARQQVGAGNARRDAHARIDGQAFGEVRGVLSVNQAAGGGNAQANLVAIGEGNGRTTLADFTQTVNGLADASLASVAAGNPSDPTPAAEAAPRREALIGGDAFARSQGLVQVNQSAGVGNASANAIVLLLPGSGP